MSNEGTGKQAQIIAVMKETGKNQLWTRPDIMQHFDWPKTASENALYNAWRGGKIFKHKDADNEGNARYALYIKEEYRKPHQQSKGTGATPGGTRKKKGALPTAKELRKMFANHMNSTAQLEDIVLGLADRLEELEKSHEKIKSLI